MKNRRNAAPRPKDDRTGEFDESSRENYQSDHENKALMRLSVGDREDAFKLGADYSPKPRPSYFYGERPIFEVGEAVTDEEQD